MEEKIVATVKAFKSGNVSIAITIPKELRDQFQIKAGTKFLVLTNNQNQIIYQFMEARD